MSRRAELIAASEGILAAARGEGRSLTAEERADLDRALADIERLPADEPAPAEQAGGAAAPAKGVQTLDRYEDLIQQRAALIRDNQQVIAEANAAGRNLTPEQMAQVRERQGHINAFSEQIDVLEVARDQERALAAGSNVIPTVHVGGPSLGGATPRAIEQVWGAKYGVRLLSKADGKLEYGGVRNALQIAIGDFLGAVIHAGTPGGMADPRLFRAAASGGSTGVPSDGGFLVGSDFSLALMEMAMSQTQLAQRCRVFEIGANSDKLEAPYVEETSRATGSRWGGVRVYRRGEADTVTAAKPTVGKFELNLEDLMGIAYLTGRADADAAALGQVFVDAFTDEFSFVLDDEIYRGTGAGQCLGIINSGNGALISVAAETGQSADTVLAENVMNMHARMHPRNRANAVWFINNEVEVQLQQMQLDIGVGGQLLYMPPGGLSAAPYATLYGRPVIAIEQASALGDVGDVVFVDLSDYILIRKGGIEQAESMHVRFLYDERAIRWMQRVNGKPKSRTTLTPYKGNNTLSPYVALAAR